MGWRQEVRLGEKAQETHTSLGQLYVFVRRRTDGGAECTEDGWIGATEYAGWNGTRKRGGSAERSEETGRDTEHIT